MPTLLEDSKKLNKEISNRFYECCDEVVEKGDVVNSTKSLINRLEYDARNFYKTRKNDSHSIPMGLISVFINIFKYNGNWIIAGIGDKLVINYEEVPKLSVEDFHREINKRYFIVVDDLVNKMKIDSLNSLANEMGIHRGVLYRLRSDDKKKVQYYMCYHLVTKYKVNGTWLLTGSGNMYR